MKSCDGCRWLFTGTIGDQTRDYCRAIPPVMRIVERADQIIAESLYPLAPAARCGLFRRRWLFWQRDKVSACP